MQDLKASHSHAKRPSLSEIQKFDMDAFGLGYKEVKNTDSFSKVCAGSVNGRRNDRVLVGGFNLSCETKETISFTIDPHAIKVT